MVKIKLEYFDTYSEQERNELVYEKHYSEITEQNGCTYRYEFSDCIEIPHGFRIAFQKIKIKSPDQPVFGKSTRLVNVKEKAEANSNSLHLTERPRSLSMGPDVIFANAVGEEEAQLITASWQGMFRCVLVNALPETVSWQ